MLEMRRDDVIQRAGILAKLFRICFDPLTRSAAEVPETSDFVEVEADDVILIASVSRQSVQPVTDFSPQHQRELVST